MYKNAYPFVQGLEFVAVQIIAVDTERNSGLRKAGYLMKAGYPIQNTVSTGDLNRGRRACRLLETWSPCSHPFAILPVSAVSDAQKLATGNFLHVRAAAFWFFFGSFPLHGKHVLVGAARCACKEASRFCKLRISSLQRRFSQNKINPFSQGRCRLISHKSQ